MKESFNHLRRNLQFFSHSGRLPKFLTPSRLDHPLTAGLKMTSPLIIFSQMCFINKPHDSFKVTSRFMTRNIQHCRNNLLLSWTVNETSLATELTWQISIFVIFCNKRLALKMTFDTGQKWRWMFKNHVKFLYLSLTWVRSHRNSSKRYN